jgi:hypothetical protein
MLPFEKDTKRVFVCFVCGEKYEEYQPYKEHLASTHEEGRDFVFCPLERCQAPVRDVKMHFKAKHPHDKIPAKGAMRSIIWKDINTKGKFKTRKPAFHEGWFVSIKNNGKEFYYRSRWECKVLEYLELIPQILRYEVEPLKGGIPYLFEGKIHHYFPDLFIYFSDGHVEIWEIKPENQNDLPINQAKWSSAQPYCESKGWRFVIINEDEISKLQTMANKIRNQQISGHQDQGLVS